MLRKLKKIIKNGLFWLVFRTLWVLFFLWFFIYMFSFWQSTTSASLSKDYIANYKISLDREKLQQLFVEIESANKYDQKSQ